MKLLIASLLLMGHTSLLYSFSPAEYSETNLKAGIAASFNNRDYFYIPSKQLYSVPLLEGGIKLGDKAMFEIEYSHLILKPSQKNPFSEERQERKSAKKIGDYLIGTGDLKTTIQFSLEKIKAEFLDLRIETKWPNAEFEPGFGTDMADINFYFICNKIYDKNGIAPFLGMKILGRPLKFNRQRDYISFGVQYTKGNISFRIKEDFFRYGLKHERLSFSVEADWKRFVLGSGFYYTDNIKNINLSVLYKIYHSKLN